MTTADYSTVRFLDATVVNFSSSLGWNDEISTVNITLVEDDDDAFNPPATGSPVTFNFGGWIFNGLLEKWVKSYSFNGNPLYEVTLVDPRNLLDGVSIILDDYNGVAPIPNIINAYGFLENLYGFGGSEKNESGIPYLLVGQAIITCTMSPTGNPYGGPIKYKDTAFGINLTNLPFLPPYFRIGGVSKMSLMEVIREICDAAGCETFFRMEYAGSLPIIKLYTISRRSIPNIGIINQFVTSTQGATSKEVGLEMVNDVCAKMVIGGKKTNLYAQTYSGGNDGNLLTGIDNTIQPFWGFSLTGDLAYGDGIGYEHTFPIDARNVNYPGLGNIYYSDQAEMVAILSGSAYWQSFLWLNWANRYRIVANGGQVDNLLECQFTNNGYGFSSSSITYRHNGFLNPHFMKAPLLRLGGNININIASLLLGCTNNTIISVGEAGFGQNPPGGSIYPVNELHVTLLKFANEFYGRKFMVRVPNVSVTQDSETDKLSYSALPATSAWLDNEDVLVAQQANRLPTDFNWITDESNKIECFVRFDNILQYNFDDIPVDMKHYNYNGTSLFVKAQIDEQFVFLTGQNFNSPRAVVTLPGIVTYKPSFGLTNSILRQFLFKMVGSQITQSTAEDFMRQLASSPLFAGAWLETDINLAITPDFAAIPIESQTDVYGPWYISTAIGKTEIEQDASLVPWNYGSSTLMNLAGQAKVSEMGVNLQNLEYGTVEYPGVPALQLGDQLLSTGPYVTDINVTIGTGGITTRYSMKSWSVRVGRLWKYTADRFFKLKKSQFDILRQLREIRRKIIK